MKNFKRKSFRLLTLVLGVLIVFCLSGCKGEAELKSDKGYVKERGKLIIGVTEFEPMDFRPEGSEWIGFDAELATKFAESLGVEAEIQEINWNTKEIELEAKSIDCIWNGMTWTEEREDQMSLSSPYLTNRQCLVIPKDKKDEIKTGNDLAGMQVAAEAGSAGESYVVDTLKDSTYIEKNSQLDALMELALGTVDCAVVDLIMAEYLIKKEGSDFSNLMSLPDFLDTEGEKYVVAFRKDSDLTQDANDYLKEMSQSGELAKLAEKYKLSEMLIQVQ